MEPKGTEIFLVRHGHRNVVYERDDNGLSELGKKQAIELSRYLFPFCKSTFSLLACSPKLRCVETLSPLSQLLGVKIQVTRFLDEHQPAETQSDFESRLEGYISGLRESESGTLVLCSHGDVLPLICRLLTHQTIHFSPASPVRLNPFGSDYSVREVKEFDF